MQLVFETFQCGLEQVESSMVQGAAIVPLAMTLFLYILFCNCFEISTVTLPVAAPRRRREHDLRDGAQVISSCT